MDRNIYGEQRRFIWGHIIGLCREYIFRLGVEKLLEGIDEKSGFFGRKKQPVEIIMFFRRATSKKLRIKIGRNLDATSPKRSTKRACAHGANRVRCRRALFEGMGACV